MHRERILAMYEEEVIYAPKILYTPMHNVLDAWISITRASGRGLGPMKWHRADRRVPFGAQKTRDFQGPTPSHFPK
jgi:hypothetical protein